MTRNIGTALICLFGLGLVSTSSAQERIWRPYVEMEGRGSTLRGVGQGNLFLPLWQDERSLFFADLRGLWTDAEAAEGNWGLVYRHILPSEWIVGLYGFYDLRHSELGNGFQQASVGAELLNVNWGFRGNGYIPEGGLALAPGLNGAFLQGNNIVVRRGEERAYYGLDFEVERLLWCRRPCESCGPCTELSWCETSYMNGWLQSLDAELWASAGVFHFDNDTPDFENITGPRVRAELRLYDLPRLGADSRLVLAGQYEYDQVRGSVGTGMLTLRVPFGRGGRRMTRMQRRMVTPIVRDIDIVTNAGPFGTPECAKFARTGERIGQALIVDGNTSDPEATIEGAGTNSVVIADGRAGTIFPKNTIDMPDGQVIMGGGSSLAVIGCNTGSLAFFTAPGTRGIFNTGVNDAIYASNNACLQSISIVTTGETAEGVSLNNDINVLMQDVAISTSGDFADGISALNNSQFTLINSTIATSGDFAEGILSNTSQFTMNNSTIFTTGSNARAIRTSNDAQFTVNNSTIITSGELGTGISAGDSQFTVNNSTIAINGDLAHGVLSNGSTFTINGGSITTSGDQSRGIQSNANSMFTLNNLTIINSGADAEGVFALENSRFTINGGSITMTGPASVGVQAISGTGDTITFLLDGVTITSTGDSVQLKTNVLNAGTINATIRNSTLTAGVGAFEINAETDGSAVQSLNVFGNMLANGTTTIIRLNEIAGDINVTQGAPGTGAGSIDLLNGILPGNVSVSGSVDFNQPAPPLP